MSGDRGSVSLIGVPGGGLGGALSTGWGTTLTGAGMGGGLAVGAGRVPGTDRVSVATTGAVVSGVGAMVSSVATGGGGTVSTGTVSTGAVSTGTGSPVCVSGAGTVPRSSGARVSGSTGEPGMDGGMLGSVGVGVSPGAGSGSGAEGLVLVLVVLMVVLMVVR